MRRFYTILFLLLISMVYSCQGKRKQQKQDFVINTYSIPVDGRVKLTLFYDNHYLVLSETEKFTCLTRSYEVDQVYTDELNTLRVVNAFVSNDSLIATRTQKGNFLFYHYDDDKKWYQLDTAQYHWESFKKRQSKLKFYEDENFDVTTCCAGEFGGSIFFTDKKTDRTYATPAICSVIINKIGSTYYLTTSLAHLGGFSQIIKIEDPTKLFELSDSLKWNCFWYQDYISFDGNDIVGMEKIEVGIEKMMDTIGVQMLTTFEYKGELYHLSSNFDKTFITQIQGDSLVTIKDSIYKSIWTYQSMVQRNGGMQISPFQNALNSGFINISNDTISIIEFGPKK